MPKSEYVINRRYHTAVDFSSKFVLLTLFIYRLLSVRLVSRLENSESVINEFVSIYSNKHELVCGHGFLCFNCSSVCFSLITVARIDVKKFVNNLIQLEILSWIRFS